MFVYETEPSSDQNLVKQEFQAPLYTLLNQTGPLTAASRHSLSLSRQYSVIAFIITMVAGEMFRIVESAYGKVGMRYLF